jgi:hypothetical protein
MSPFSGSFFFHSSDSFPTNVLLLNLLPGSHVPPPSSSPTCYKGSPSPITVQVFSSVTAQILQHNGMGKMGPESRLLPPSCQSASYGCVVPPGSESRQLHNPSLVNTAERKSQLHFYSTDDNPGPVNTTRTIPKRCYVSRALLPIAGPVFYYVIHNIVYIFQY